MVVTSYSIVASEHGAFKPDAKDESKGKSKAKAKKQDSSDSDDYSDGDDPSDSSANFGKTLTKKPSASSRKKQAKDALFRIKWWRIVLGTMYPYCDGVEA